MIDMMKTEQSDTLKCNTFSLGQDASSNIVKDVVYVEVQPFQNGRGVEYPIVPIYLASPYLVPISVVPCRIFVA